MVLAHQPKSPPTAHDKKRRGHHHKADRHYAKTYWPYLPMLLVVFLGFVVNAMWSAKSNVLSYATSVSQTTLLQETNIQRDTHGRSALALNGLLSKAAQDKANDMAARNYWSHTTPEGTQPWQFIAAAGYNYLSAGENLAYGFDSSATAVAGWMNSPGHRANLLNSDFREVGFGIANNPNYQGDGEQTIIVAMYASPEKVLASAPATTAPPSAPKSVPSSAPTQANSSPTPSELSPAVSQNTPASESAPAPSEVQQTTPLYAQSVSRIDVLTDGNAQWIILAASVLVTIGAISLIYRHGRLWSRYLTKSEQFIIRHPVADTAVVVAMVVTILLTRTSGFIH